MTDGNYHEVCEASARCHHFLSNLALPAAHQLRDHLKVGLTMLPDPPSVTEICKSLVQPNRFFISALDNDSAQHFLPFQFICNFLMIHEKYVLMA